MGMFSSKNVNRTVNEKINTEGFEFVKLKDFAQTVKPKDVTQLFGWIISNKGKYGASVAVVAEDCFISLPKRYVDWFQGLTGEERVAFIEGKCGITNIREQNTENGVTYVFDWVDID